MSVSLNWDRLSIVCEKEGEELHREEAAEKSRDEVVLKCFTHGAGNLLQLYLLHVIQKNGCKT